MKTYLNKIGSFVLIFSFVLGLSGIATTYAQTNQQVLAACGPSSPKKFAVGSTDYVNCATQYRAEFQAANGGTSAPANTSGGSLLETISAGIADAALFVPAQLALFILQLADYLVWLSGAILNFVIQYSVVDMKTNLEKANSINNAWKLVRDICNMAFIFVLLYAAIQQILGIGKDVKGLIVRVVVVAVLINFSLFFTKFVIDMSNIFALMFYDAIAPGALSKTISGGLSNSLMEPLQLQTVYKSVEGGILNGRKLFITGVMGTILSLIAAFTFFAVAIMFIIRFVVLMFVLVLSPIAFIASILPQAEKYKSQWFDALLGQAFFAPIYFMLTWVVIVISRGVLTNKGNLATVINGVTGPNGEAVAPDPSAVGVLVNFLILIALMVSSLTIAKEWANKAGPGMGKLTSWATGVAGGATVGLAGRFTKNTLGRGAEAFKDSSTYKRLQTFAPNSRMARLAVATTNKTAGGSYDMRGAPGIGGVLSGTMGSGGPAGVGGFTAKQEKKDKERRERSETARKAQGELDIVAGVAPGATPLQIDAMERAIASATDKEIEAIVASNKELLNSQEFSNRISVKQLEAINKSDKFTEAEKDSIKNGPNGKYSAINANVAAGAAATSRGAIRGMSDSELEMIDPATLTDHGFVSQLRTAQIEAIGKSGKFTSSQKTDVRNARRAPLLAAVAGGSIAPADILAAQTAMRDLGPEEIAALDVTPAALLSPTMLHAYTQQMLKRMGPKLNPADVLTLGSAISAAGGPAAAWVGSPDGRNNGFSI